MAGDRAPDLAFAGDAGATRLYDLLGSGRFVLLSIGAPCVQLPDDLRPLATVASVDGAEGYDSGHVDLIRPGAHVAMSVQVGGDGALIDALRVLRCRQVPGEPVRAR